MRLERRIRGQLRSERSAANCQRARSRPGRTEPVQIILNILTAKFPREKAERESTLYETFIHMRGSHIQPYGSTVGHRQLITRTAVNGHRAGCARLWRKRAESAVAGLRGTSGSIVSARDLRPANRWPRACRHQRATNEGRENNARAALGSAAAGSTRSQHHLSWILS